MESVPGFRPYYQCPCGAYRWLRSATNKGETHCLQCGSPFTGAQLRFWPKQRLGDPTGRTQSHTVQHYGGRRYEEYNDAKGAGGKGAKGANRAKGAHDPQGGKGGKGQRPPQQPGLLSSTGAGHRATGAATQANPAVTYNKARASKDELYKARKHMEMVRGLWGEDHPYTAAAKQGLEAAEKDALQKQPPEKKLATLRQEHTKTLNSVQQGLHRCDEIEATMAALQQEYYDMEEAVAVRAKRAEDLQAEIDAQEADLPEPAVPGAQRGLRDQLHSVLHAHTRKSGKNFSDRRRQRVMENLEELLRDFEDTEPDADMEGAELDSLPSLGDSDGEPPAAKQRRERARGQDVDAAAAEEEGDWQRGLGAVGRKLAKRGDLGKRTVQQLQALQAQQGGKAKGKGAGKGKGKGITYSAVVRSPAPPLGTRTSATPTGADGAAGTTPASSSATGLPSAAVAPGEVPAGGSLTGGWPTLGAATAVQAAQVPIPAAAHCAHQAQLRRGEGTT